MDVFVAAVRLASGPRCATALRPAAGGWLGRECLDRYGRRSRGAQLLCDGAGEARKGRWSIFGDFVYVDFGNQHSEVRSVDFNPGPGPVNVTTTQLNSGTQTALDATVFTLVGGYSLVQVSATLDLIAGVRYTSVKASTDWNLTAVVTGPAGAATFARTGSVERSDDLFDGVIGARGRVRFGNSPWFAPYYIDVGAGSSELTWQGAAGVGYAFRWGEVVLSYKYLYYDQGDDKFIQKLELWRLCDSGRISGSRSLRTRR